MNRIKVNADGNLDASNAVFLKKTYFENRDINSTSVVPAKVLIKNENIKHIAAKCILVERETVTKVHYLAKC